MLMLLRKVRPRRRKEGGGESEEGAPEEATWRNAVQFRGAQPERLREGDGDYSLERGAFLRGRCQEGPRDCESKKRVRLRARPP